MVPPLDGPLKKPTGGGFMGPLAILKVVEAAEQVGGHDLATPLQKAAQLHRLPSLDEPVREEKVARLHQTLRRDFPEQAEAVLTMAGQMAGDFVIDRRLSKRAQAMMAKMPWPAGAWLLGRSILQNDWAMSGSGTLSMPTRMELQLRNGPTVKGETADRPVCHYHAALLGRVYSASIHSDLKCTELRCTAKGDDCCHFAIHV